ncbi:SusC/RagA family TonB-linked outer membrane protein [Chryseobacterium sp. DT-3]|uniref:SusC/RagA family TonB-linked outer membrane protein n=1 Tax=Chryseobacterium sp. DT-3 TaxID=3396164 RepID=UPI003F1C8A7E
MKQRDLKYSCLIAVLYFGMNVNAQTTPKDTLKEQKIEEVVLIGYGSQKKENVTGSIATISAKDISDRPNSNPISSIQGKVSGVQILNSGAPGASPRVDIRGIGSITGKTVFIVDGMITDDISFLNPQDIESMSILKDPSSLAIFGAKASNGAVIIKTKTGKGKKPTFNFNSYLGVKKVTNVPKMVNGDQYVELYNEKYMNDIRVGGQTFDPTKIISRSQFPADTNWFDEVLSQGIISSSDISASGNLGKLNYFLSLGYLKDEGTLEAGRGINSGNDFGRLNTRINLSYKITDNLTIGDNFTWADIHNNNANNPLLTAYNAPPVFYSIDPTTNNYDYITLVSVTNPRAMLDLFRSKTRQQRMLNNIWAEYKFLKDFTLRVSYTSDNTNTSKYEFTPTATYIPLPNRSLLVTRDSRNRDYVWDNTLSWKKKLGLHNIELLAGFSRTQNYYRENYLEARDILFNGKDSSLDISTGNEIYGTTISPPDDPRAVTPYKKRIESTFGRLNYDYAGKYLLNASVRRDGATGFSSDDRYKVFPAVSIGWVISKEGFMSNQNVFNLLKLRASWGKLGNPEVSRDYDNLTSILTGGAYFGGVGNPAQTITRIVDPTITWETTTGRDLGLEMALLNNKLKIEATYFDKDSKDVVYGINQPATSGASNANNFVTNAYSFNNKGFEGSVSYDAKVNDHIKFSVFGNITTLDNKITSVYADSYNQPGVSLFGNPIIRLEKGQAVGSYYGYNVIGVFQNDAQVAAAPTYSSVKKTVGGFMFEDRDGNGVIDANDKTFLGSPIPKFTYGFGFNVTIYDFDLAMDFQGVSGNKIYNYNREQRFGNESWDLDFYNNRWHGEGTSNTYAMTTNDQGVIVPSSFYVENGSFFRIRNIQIGYNLPKDVLGTAIQKLRFYASAQNPWTSFKYHGFSPEILNTDRVQMGIDNNIYPISAIYTVGVNVTF